MTTNNRNPDNTLINVLTDPRPIAIVVRHDQPTRARLLMLPIDEMPLGLRRDKLPPRLWPAVEVQVNKHGRWVLDGMGRPARVNRKELELLEKAMERHVSAGTRLIFGRTRLPGSSANDDRGSQDGAA